MTAAAEALCICPWRCFGPAERQHKLQSFFFFLRNFDNCYREDLRFQKRSWKLPEEKSTSPGQLSVLTDVELVTNAQVVGFKTN